VQAALGDETMAKHFEVFAVNEPAAPAGASSSAAKLEDKTAVLLCCGSAVDDKIKAAAAEAKAALLARSGAAEVQDTVMQVDRNGEQHYRQESKLGSLVTLHEVDGAVDGARFATTAVRWVAERLERRKLERLGSLLPWHEFK
jgi:hypothetical protein